MQVFGRTAPLLAEVACRRALEQARIEPDRISHLVLVTSTGFMTPGPDIVLAKRLGLRPDVERTVVAMHGCAGGTTGLSAAQRIARSDPDAMVLLVAVEICSIHLRDGTRRDAMVANSLFADGAAAAVLRAVEPGEECLAALGSRHTEVVPDSHRVMEWTLHPTGFDLRLSRDLPDLVHDSLKRLGEAGLAGSRSHDGGRAPITSWVVHPGGPGVLRAVLESLSLDHSALASSARVLREHGNLSSATVLFVLRAELDARSFDAGKQRGVIMSFGPGMCLDTIEFSPGGAPI